MFQYLTGVVLVSVLAGILGLTLSPWIALAVGSVILGGLLIAPVRGTMEMSEKNELWLQGSAIVCFGITIVSVIMAFVNFPY